MTFQYMNGNAFKKTPTERNSTNTADSMNGD